MTENETKLTKIELGKTYRRKDMPHVWIRADRFFNGSIVGPTSEGYRHIVPLNVIRDYFEEVQR